MKTKEFKVKRGDLILTERPFVYCLQSKYRDVRCDFCFQLNEMKRCTACNYVHYCNKICQKNAWKQHKIECNFLKKIHPRIVPDAARILSKIILKLNNGGDMEKSYYTESSFRRFRDLMSHYAELKNDPKRIDHLESLYHVLCDLLGDTIVPNKCELLIIYGRLITNGFNILDHEMNTVGTGIYLGVSVTDHSCKPNAVATFEGITLNVRAIEDMENLDWSKVFISYIDLLNTTEIRRKELEENYYFICNCSKCSDKVFSDSTEGAMCPNKNCKASVNVKYNNCELCNAGITPKLRSAYFEAMEFTKSQLTEMRDVAYLDVLKLCLKKQSETFHPMNVWRLKTLENAFESAIDINQWEDAIEFGRNLITGFQKYHGKFNPVVGVFYLKLGKLELYKENLKNALDCFEMSKEILLVTHGKESPIFHSELSPLLYQTRNEIDSKHYS